MIDDFMDGLCGIPGESRAGFVKISKYDLIHCKFTDRVLKPVIYQDFSVNVPWLKVQDEVIQKVKDNEPEYPVRKRDRLPLNYVYVQSEHIAAINCLSEAYFWPGIDMSGVLNYPEFSCVALYGKIVVGFGFLSPGDQQNEGYISFLFVRPHWRQSGIGSFILYHLINTCMSWNITLHVSSSNSSMMLYQKFGFKAYKVLNGFYDKYFPLHSNESRQAVFLKLER